VRPSRPLRMAEQGGLGRGGSFPFPPRPLVDPPRQSKLDMDERISKSFPHTKVLVFARAPEPGAAKTRLIPLLGPERAAALQRVLIERALRTALASGVGEVELWCAPSALHPQLVRCCREFGVASANQCEGDLGA